MTQVTDRTSSPASLPSFRAEANSAQGMAHANPLMRLAWLAVAAVVILAVASVIRWTMPRRMPVRVSVDGRVETVASFRPTVGALLADLGVRLRPEDRLTPSLPTPLTPGLSVSIERARPYLLEVDGKAETLYSHALTVGELLAETKVILKPGDEVWLRGLAANSDAELPRAEVVSQMTSGVPARPWRPDGQPVHLAIKRSTPLTVFDDSVSFPIYTTQDTIGEALAQAGLTLYLGDQIQPSLGTAVRPGLRVFIARSRSVLVSADGHTVHTRTQGHTVGDALVDLGVLVSGADRVSPALDRAMADGMEIKVTRVREVVAVEREIIPNESIMVADDELELDSQRLAQPGEEGEFRRRFRLIFEDGAEASRTLMDAWVAAEPVTRITAYGRKLVSRPLETEEGPVSYWRKTRMYATSYSPARSGTPKTAPWYGRTRIGLPLRKGIVAVDPSVIPMRSRVYVPGYGIAIAGDTGGGVRGKWIDLGFEDHNYESWHRWVDVYVLDPPPEPRQIRWVLPNYPPPGFPKRR